MTIFIVIRENEDTERPLCEDTQTHRNTRKTVMLKWRQGIKLMLLKAQEHLGLPETRRGRERSPLRGECSS